MPIRFTAVSAVLVSALLAAGCGSSNDSGSSSAQPASGRAYGQPAAKTTSAAGERETIKTATAADLGIYLVDEGGKAVYLFEQDSGTTSTCYDACAQVWPPVTTSGDPAAEGAVKASQLSTTTRKDGTTQVLYGGHPLYYYAPDQAGTTNGQGLDQFGAEWYVLAPSGKKIEGAES